VGQEGVLSVFSFYATKMISTGHGGAVTTRDRVLADRIRDLVEVDNRDDYRVRYNYRMSALVAGLGRVQLARVPDFVKRRRRIADYYCRTLELGELPQDHIFYRFVLRVGSVGRFVRFMSARGVECKRPVCRPLHRYFSGISGEYPGAEEMHRSWASLPIYPSLRREERDRVARAACSFLE
jgi:perosamine synthetase